jgi:hypothetical protein
VERCPICRAALNGAETCRRCRAELRQVQRIEQLASELAGAAMLALAQGHCDEARRLLARARLLHATPAVQALWRLTTDAVADVVEKRGGVTPGLFDEP